MYCFTKKMVFKKLGYPELEFEGDRRIIPTCVILALETKRLLHKDSALDRELKFEIELLPGSAPVSIPPYRMALAELK